MMTNGLRTAGRRAWADGWRSRDRLLWSVVGAAVVLTIAMRVVASFATEPRPPRMPPGAITLPRMGGRPPTSVRDLLHTLGVGSIIWYACFVSAPLFFWMGRRLPFDRRRWMRSVVAHLVVIVALATLTAWIQYRLNYHGSPLAPPLSAYLQVGLITG